MLSLLVCLSSGLLYRWLLLHIIDPCRQELVWLQERGARLDCEVAQRPDARPARPV
jgi:hypothetical protein